MGNYRGHTLSLNIYIIICHAQWSLMLVFGGINRFNVLSSGKERPGILIAILQNSSIRNFGQVIVVMLKYAAWSLYIRLIKQGICQDSCGQLSVAVWAKSMTAFLPSTSFWVKEATVLQGPVSVSVSPCLFSLWSFVWSSGFLLKRKNSRGVSHTDTMLIWL